MKVTQTAGERWEAKGREMVPSSAMAGSKPKKDENGGTAGIYDELFMTSSPFPLCFGC